MAALAALVRSLALGVAVVEPVDAVVVGAGITGLVAARELAMRRGLGGRRRPCFSNT